MSSEKALNLAIHISFNIYAETNHGGPSSIYKSKCIILFLLLIFIKIKSH